MQRARLIRLQGVGPVRGTFTGPVHSMPNAFGCDTSQFMRMNETPAHQRASHLNQYGFASVCADQAPGFTEALRVKVGLPHPDFKIADITEPTFQESPAFNV